MQNCDLAFKDHRCLTTTATTATTTTRDSWQTAIYPVLPLERYATTTIYSRIWYNGDCTSYTMPYMPYYSLYGMALRVLSGSIRVYMALFRDYNGLFRDYNGPF